MEKQTYALRRRKKNHIHTGKKTGTDLTVLLPRCGTTQGKQQGQNDPLLGTKGVYMHQQGSAGVQEGLTQVLLVFFFFFYPEIQAPLKICQKI